VQLPESVTATCCIKLAAAQRSELVDCVTPQQSFKLLQNLSNAFMTLMTPSGLVLPARVLRSKLKRAKKGLSKFSSTV
jgi:hypothetical protein